MSCFTWPLSEKGFISACTPAYCMQDDEGEDGELEVGWRTSWWKKQGVLWFAGSVVAAAVLVVVGMLLQCSVIRAIKVGGWW